MVNYYVSVYTLKNNIGLAMLTQRPSASLNSFPFLAVPLFILAGELMNMGGITKRLIKFSDCLVGWIPGGLAHTNIVASIVFAGMSGSAVADAGGLGSILVPAMKSEGFDDEFSVGVTAASSTIGPIVPPSIPMVLYGLGTGVSVTALFLGGLLPGLLMGATQMVAAYMLALKRHYPKHKRPSLKQFLRSTTDALPALLMPFIMMSGIILGVFTPTEAAAVTVAYGFFVGLVLYRELPIRDIPRLLETTCLRTAQVAFIVGYAMLFGWLLGFARVPELVASLFLRITSNRLGVLLLINVFLLIVGMFMDGVAAMLILIPVFVPVVTKLGISPVHFGVMMVLNLMIGLVTPPVGACLYVLTDIAKISFERVVRGIAPFLIPLVIALLLVTCFPELVLFIPRLLLGSV